MRDAHAKVDLRALTGLRFVAALHVLTYHALFTFSRFGDRVLPSSILGNVCRSFLASGYVSVDFFFVLSGFVLAYAYLDSESQSLVTSTRRFWLARFARIYPMHAVGVLLTLPLFILGSHEARASSFTIARGGARQVAISLSLLQAWFPRHVFDLNGPAWSLSAETFFYACFPFLARVFVRRNTRALMVIATLSWFIAIVPPILLRDHKIIEGVPQDEAGMILLFNPLLHLANFAIGVATGILFLRRPKMQHARVIAVASASTIVIVLTCSDRIPFALLHNGLCDPLWALLIFAMASSSARLPMFSSAWMWTLGRASYALYVIHKPIFFWLAREVKSATWVSVQGVALYALGSIGLSIVLWRLIEEPLRRKLIAL
jgi:peptidoglycan/LPS O-acetylase OafA/YrhL